MAAEQASIPADAVERFTKAMAAFVKAVREAVAEAEGNPELALAPAFQPWKSKVLPLLEQQNGLVQEAARRFAQGDTQSIVILAEDKRGLAKDMEGFPLTFAGEDRAGELDELQTHIVLFAYQVCEAAGIP